MNSEFNPGIWTSYSRIQVSNHSIYNFLFPLLWYDTSYSCLYINFIFSPKLWKKEYYFTYLSNPLIWEDFPFKQKKHKFYFSLRSNTQDILLSYSVSQLLFTLPTPLFGIRERRTEICYMYFGSTLQISLVIIALGILQILHSFL